MGFDWSALWPVIMFLPVFVMIMFQARRRAPLSPAMRRRALVIGSIGSVLGIALAVISLSRLATPGQGADPAPAVPRQARVLPPQAPAVPPPAQLPQPR